MKVWFEHAQLLKPDLRFCTVSRVRQQKLVSVKEGLSLALAAPPSRYNTAKDSIIRAKGQIFYL